MQQITNYITISQIHNNHLLYYKKTYKQQSFIKLLHNNKSNTQQSLTILQKDI